MRVTGGSLGGRRLRVPRRGVRPTADRVRESLFAILGDLSDARVLDLYAGSGALGIEALSRGASFAVFVERALASLDVLQQNLTELDLGEHSRVLRSDVVRGLGRLAKEGERFDLVLADPPYDTPVDPTLSALVASGVLVPGGTLVVERGRGHVVEPIEGLVPVSYREYGDTAMTHFEACGDFGG
jgi:16S rRNA (guanine966-N2)-methyltransferase